jgi:hypothetical protein
MWGRTRPASIAASVATTTQASSSIASDIAAKTCANIATKTCPSACDPDTSTGKLFEGCLWTSIGFH